MIEILNVRGPNKMYDFHGKGLGALPTTAS